MSESTYNNANATQTMPAWPANSPDIPEMTDLTKAAGNTLESKLSSGELGILWSTFQTRTVFYQMFKKFAEQTTEPKAKKILDDYVAMAPVLIDDLTQMFQKEKAVVPVGFTEKDVFSNTPRLFDDEFHIMFLRSMAKSTIGFNGISMGMSYRADVRAFFEKASKFSMDLYNEATDYLTDQKLLTRPPYFSMPTEVDFVDDLNYIGGTLFRANKRALNAIEIAHIYTAIELNTLKIQLMTAFAQTAKEAEVKTYQLRGKELAKKISHELIEICVQSDIQPSATWAGKATDSVVPIFSDKMMMSLTNIFTSLNITDMSFGLMFSIRSDLPVKYNAIVKDLEEYALEGSRVMIRHNWLEAPPQMEDRGAILASKQ